MPNSISNLPTALFGPEPPEGTRLGNYVLLQKLGAGGMGQVWKAAHHTTGELYAVKLLPAMLASHPDAWDQVLANFQLVRKLNHQNICPVHLLERDPKWGPYLVMTFIDGISLAKYRQRKETFTVEEVAALLQPVAEALDYAHAQKIIHRDVKHDNILLTLADDGETITGTFVIDFGLAAQVRSTINRFSQQSVTAAGTRPYMAPEIWRSRPPVAASDQYALAVIAYEMLAGYFPFDNDDLAVLREAVLKDEVEPIESIGEAANQFLRQALAKEIGKRFVQGCLDFLSQIGQQTVLGASSFEAEKSATEFERRFLEYPHPEPSFLTDQSVSHFAKWNELADFGSLSAQFAVGMSFVDGFGVEKDLKKGLHWLSRAAGKGHLLSCALSGLILWRHKHGPHSRQQGKPLLETAAQGGVVWAALMLGKFIEDESADRDDKESALRWYERAMTPGSAEETVLSVDAKFHVGRLLLTENLKSEAVGGVEDAVQLVTETAEAGLPAAQSFLGFAYFNGSYGLMQDDRKAAHWCKKASESDDDQAICFMAERFYDGRGGILVDSAKACQYWRRAAEHGHPVAQLMCGRHLQEGIGVKANPSEAIKWYEAAGEQGLVPGMMAAAGAYGNGIGVPLDLTQSFQWTKKAAESGDAEAASNLASMFNAGLGTSASSDSETYWLRRAASKGHPSSCFILAGKLWDGGKGSQSAISEAIDLLAKAKRQVDDDPSVDSLSIGDALYRMLGVIARDHPELQQKVFDIMVITNISRHQARYKIFIDTIAGA